jgi:hypothetical protein
MSVCDTGVPPVIFVRGPRPVKRTEITAAMPVSSSEAETDDSLG